MGGCEKRARRSSSGKSSMRSFALTIVTFLLIPLVREKGSVQHIGFLQFVRLIDVTYGLIGATAQMICRIERKIALGKKAGLTGRGRTPCQNRQFACFCKEYLEVPP